MIEPTAFTYGGTSLAATLYRPDGAVGPVPAVVAAQGFGNVKEVFLPHLAEHLAEAGIATLAFDFAGFGDSGGEPRQHVDPVAQLAQYGAALGDLAQRDGIDADRLGVCGVSLAGGHAMRLSATDARVRCAVGLVPFIATDSTGTPPELIEAIIADATARERGEPYGTIPMIGQPGDLAVITADAAAEMLDFMTGLAPNLRNEVTLASLLEVAAYQPLAGIDALHAPLRVVLATQDSVNPPAAARAALKPFGGVDQIEIPGTHFSVFTNHFAETVAATVEWFSLNL
jgi:dienelactone hydrolase